MKAPYYNAIRLLEKRIDGSITAEEAGWLNQRMEVDVTLQRELRFRQELEKLSAEAEIDRLRQELVGAWMDTQRLDLTNSELEYRFSRIKKYFYAAATLAGLTAGGIGIHSALSNGANPTALYAENFEPYPPVRVVRSNGELSSDSLFFRGMIAYQSGYFNTSKDDFETLMKSGNTSTTVRFYLGVSYMELNDFGKAREALNAVAQANSLFKEQSIWYTGLCYLGEGNVADARKALSELVNSGTPISAKAEQLLKKLPE
ncbi:MAG TPA: tetratricopeptide repeat protein [Williamwhitmania sp.]|nr:tetratricopeptide repeat protein [Williamwhitmania sp.]